MTSDQAAALRSLAQQQKKQEPITEVKTELISRDRSVKRARIITTSSGKGGVGKTNCSASLSYLLYSRGRKVLLVDFDFGMGNTDLIVGAEGEVDITKMIKEDVPLDETVIKTRYGFDFIKGVRDVDFADLSQGMFTRILKGFQELELKYDDIIIDTGAGAHHIVIQSILRADVKLFILKPERSSWEDAYQIIKHIRHRGYTKGFKILVNMAKTKRKADLTAHNFLTTCRDKLKVNVDYLGFVPEDPLVVDAINAGEIFVAKYPNSQSSVAFREAFKEFVIGKEDLRKRNYSYFETLLSTEYNTGGESS